MTTIIKYITAVVLAMLALASCNTEPSLQEYLVAKQDDSKFVKVDLPSSLLDTKQSNLDAEQKEILKTVKKMNVVAYPIKDGNEAEYRTEKQKVKTILDDEKYQLLSKLNFEGTNVTLKYVGKEDAIDEVIVLASNDTKGFTVVRLLGKNMRPEKMMQLISSMDSSDMNTTQLNGILGMFDM
ncbi:DUF4252 domain-containing protein [Jejudonia soesokkakensis]|uniref:DUF4252 domain-containing protein n=1 Tax=Jejudonia soesokkakensis TaxID=1323432 RepID=A0ABW2MUB0_9FLAO